MVASESSMYNRVPAFRTIFDSTLYTSLKQTRVALYECDKQTGTGDRNGKFYFKAWSVFQDDFMNS